MRDKNTLLFAHFQKNPFAEDVYNNILKYSETDIDAFDNNTCRKWVKKLLKSHLKETLLRIAAGEQQQASLVTAEYLASLMPTNDIEETYDVFRYTGMSELKRVSEKVHIDVSNNDYILITNAGIKINQHFALGRPDSYTMQLIQQCDPIGKMTSVEYSKLAGAWVSNKPHGADGGASYEEALSRVNQRISDSITIG